MKIHFWLETSLDVNIQAFSVFLFFFWSGGGVAWEVVPFELISVLLSLLQYWLQHRVVLKEGMPVNSISISLG